MSKICKRVSGCQTISVRRIGTARALMFTKTGQRTKRYHEFGRSVPLYVTDDRKHIVIPARFVRGQIEG